MHQYFNRFNTKRCTEETYWNGDINWVTTDDLGKLETKDSIESRRLITEEGFNSSGTYLAPVDSIVLSTRAPIGHIGILTIEACTNQGCKTIIAIKNSILFF
ncbi:MAG: restriction endonuclease subunit S [Bacteroidales bacterium]